MADERLNFQTATICGCCNKGSSFRHTYFKILGSGTRVWTLISQLIYKEGKHYTTPVVYMNFNWAIVIGHFHRHNFFHLRSNALTSNELASLSDILLIGKFFNKVGRVTSFNFSVSKPSFGKENLGVQTCIPPLHIFIVYDCRWKTNPDNWKLTCPLSPLPQTNVCPGTFTATQWAAPAATATTWWVLSSWTKTGASWNTTRHQNQIFISILSLDNTLIARQATQRSLVQL